MKRKLLFLIVVAGVLYSSVTSFSKVVQYFIEFESYKRHCKNRDNQEITCNGICQLSKEIATDDLNTEPAQPALPSIEHILPLFFQSSASDKLPQGDFSNCGQERNFHIIVFNSQEFVKKLIKPPTVV